MKPTANHAARVHTLGIDLAKQTFSLHGVDGHGNPVFSNTVSRAKLLEYLQQLPPCTIAMINQLRGLLSEFGIVMAKGRYPAQAALIEILDDDQNGVPPLARRLLRDVHQRLLILNEQLLGYDRELEHHAKQSPHAQRLMSIPGIGAITATALIASIGDPGLFKNGRQFAAWLGLVPRQFTTGGVIRLGRITKQGDKYLRMLLIHGTRAVLASLKDKRDKLSQWTRALIERRGYKRATVALAAKNARIVWAVLSHQTEYTARLAAS